MRAEGRTVLALDAGDPLFSGSNVPKYLRAKWIRKADLIRVALCEMQYDAVNVGDHDLAAGVSYLLNGRDGLPLLSSNLVAPDSGEPVFQPYILRDIDGLRVGIIGLLNPQWVKRDSVVANDPVDAAAKIVKELRGRCDLLIALSHLERTAEMRLTKKVPEIDVLISGGHTGSPLRKPQRKGRTVIVRTSKKGASLGQLDLWLAPGFEALYDSSEAVETEKDKGDRGYYRHTLVSINSKIEDDPRIGELIAAYKESVGKGHSGRSAEKVRAYLGARRCQRCHTAQHEAWGAHAHARAYGRLVKEGRGSDPECIGCHSTGYRTVGGFWDTERGPRLLGGVQCEACHGPGSVHVERRGKGYVSKAVASDVCLKCHTPARDATFDFEADLHAIRCPPPETRSARADL